MAANKEKTAPLEKLLLLAMIVTAVLGTLGMAFAGPLGLSDTWRYLLVGIAQCGTIAFGATLGLLSVRKFTFESSLGKAFALISCGIASWGIGNVFFTYYTLALADEAPYPSVADVGFTLGIPLGALGLWLLFRDLEPKMTMKSFAKAFSLPVISAILMYIFFIRSALVSDTPFWQKFIDVLYPVGDTLFLGLSFAILGASWGGRLSKPFSTISLGYLFLAGADIAFSIATKLPDYKTGTLDSILYTIGFCLIGVGLYRTREILE